MLGLLCHVITVKMEHQMLPQLSLSSNCELVSQFCSQLHTDCQSAEWYRHHDFAGGKEEI